MANMLKKITALLLSFNMLILGVPASVLASEISGVTPNGNVYNIEGNKFSNQTQFRHYDKFNLSQGDIANLIYKNGYKNFVNLVNNQVNINGIVNTMRDNNFYNGHAIFVSPNGIVIGASGVLNVGSLSLLTPSQSSYNAFLNAYNGTDASLLSKYEVGASAYKSLITDSHGNIVVNGKILARNDVNLYGDNISIKGSANEKAGIIAGWKDENTIIDTNARAKEVFNSLVSNNIKDATNFNLENGKIVIVAGDKDVANPTYQNNAVVEIENAEIASNNIDISANSSASIGKLDSVGFPDEIVAKIIIKNSELSADDVNILVNATNEVNRQINLIEPTILAWILEDDSHISEFFSSDVMEGFEGAKSSATVDVIGSSIKTNKDLTINTSSSSTLNVDSDLISGFVPAIFYALGTKTNSQINIKNSKLNAGGDVNILASSNNEAEVFLSNSSFITITPTDAYAMMFLNYNTISTTKVIIDNSTVEAENLNLFAVNYGSNSVEIELYITVGENDFSDETTGASGVSLASIYNHSKNDTEVSVINSSKIETTNDVNLISQSVNINTNSVKSVIEYSDSNKSEKKVLDTWLKDKLGKIEESTTTTFKSIIEFFQGDLAAQGGKELIAPQFKIGGDLVINSTNNNATVKIDNSSIKSNNLLMSSHTVDLVGNNALTVSKGDSNYGVGIAVVTNNQLNNTTSNINSSKIESNTLTEEAITEIPTTQGTIQLGLKLPVKDASIQLGVSFGGGVDADDWSIKMTDIFKYDKEAPIFSFDSSLAYKYDKMKPSFAFKGFFNNFAKSGSNGKVASMSGSVVNNSVTNNTVASITGGSEVVVKNGNANIYAVNSVVGYNAVGNVDFMMDLANGLLPDWIAKGGYRPGVEAGTGIGGSVLINNYENNATATIDNSSVKVAKGDLNIGSATEQGYISALAIGGKSTGFIMDGSVHVQNITGSTISSITNSNNISASNINVNAGKANVKLATDKISVDDESGLLKTEDNSRDVVDHIKNIILGGALAQQSKKTDDPNEKTSAGVAVGADVNVSSINRIVSAFIDNSTVTANNNANVIADTKTQNLNVSIAGAFAGGVSVNKEKQEQGQQAGNNQQADNVGNWMDIVDNAGDEEENVLFGDLFNENNANQEGANVAQNNANNINQANGQINNNGQVQGNNGGNAGNVANNNGNLAGNNNVANPNAVSNNMSIAAAGSVSVINDKSTVTSKVTNSTINVGKELNVKANQTSSNINISGATAKAGSVGAGAGVNIYRNNTITQALIGDDTNEVIINYTNSDNNKSLNLNADNNVSIVNVALGIGAASNDEQGTKTAVGGSFNYNKLADTVSAIMNNTNIKNNDGITNNIAVNVLAKDNSSVWNISGSAGYVGGGTTGIGAGIAGNSNLFKSSLNSKIVNSNLKNVSDVKVNSILSHNANSVGVAGAIVNGANSSYTFDGAVAVELFKNSVYSFIENSEIVASGDVEVVANAIMNNQSLAGALEFSNSTSGLGVGLGAIVSVMQNEVLAKTNGLKLNSSKSVKISADETEDIKYLAVNMGLQTGGENKINVNGIANVFLSTVNATVVNNSILNSTGNVNVLANYNNKSQGITLVGDKANQGLAIGANSVTSYYKNNVKSLLENESSITTSGDVSINSTSIELINMIPLAVTVASSGNAVAGNVLVNIIKNNAESYVYGDINITGDLLVNATDFTTLYERGGTLAFGGSTASVGGTVDVDYLSKTVKSEINGATVKSGDTSISATSETSFGGTKKDDGTYDVKDISDSNNLIKKDVDGNYIELDENSDFKNWNMMYDLEGGNNASVSGVVFVKVVENTVSAKIIDSDMTSNSLTVNANDYAIVNAIVGKFNKGGDASIGGNVFVYVTNSDVDAWVDGSTKLSVDNDINIVSYSKRDNNVILIGGGGSSKVAINGSAYVNVSNDDITSKIGSGVVISSVKNLIVDSVGVNSLFSANLSVAGSGKASIGGIFYYNKVDGSVKSLVGDSNNRLYITSSGNIKVSSDSDNSVRAYLFNVAGSGKVAVAGCGLVNDIVQTSTSEINNSNLKTSEGKIEVVATRGFNRSQKDKSNVFRNWFKDTSAYKTNGLVEDTDVAKLYPIVGALNVGGAGNVAVSATMILNTMSGDVLANVKNSTISSKDGLNISAIQDFVSFDTISAVAGASNVAVNAVGVINLLEETVESKLSNSIITNGGVSVNSKSNIDMNQLVIAGEGVGTGASIGAVVDVNKITDKVHSYVEDSNVEGDVSLDAEHVIEINNIILSGSGAGTGLSLSVVPIVNTYNGETLAGIYSTSEKYQITNGEITVNANDYIDNFTAVAGASIVGTGGALSGFVINNNYDNTVKAYIDKLIIDTQKDILISSSSNIDSTNAILSASIVGVGGSILANVIVNGIGSNVLSYIDNSEIKNSGAIGLSVNKDKQDKITNTTGNVEFAGEGANITTNVIYNLYKNIAKSYIQGSSIDNSKSISVESYSDRIISNTNIAIGGTAIGATVGVNANVNNVDTTTSAFIDTGDNTINTVGKLGVFAKDTTIAENIIGSVGIAGLGASVITNIVMNAFDNLALANIITGENNLIKAGSVELNSNSIYALSSDYVGVSLGAGGLAGCITIVDIGKRNSDYTTSETKSGINTAVERLNDIYSDTTKDETSDSVKNRFTPKTTSSTETGTISRLNGNVKTTTGDLNVLATSKVAGLSHDWSTGKYTITDTLDFSNTAVNVGGVVAGVGVENIKLSNLTLAEISSSNLDVSGDIEVKSQSDLDVNITNTDVDVALIAVNVGAGCGLQGASGMYNNKSETISRISDSTITSNNLSVISKSSNKVSLNNRSVIVSAGSVGVSIAELNNENKSSSIIAGNTNITASGKLKLQATNDTDLSASMNTVNVSAVNLVSYMTNTVNSNSVASALIKDVIGEINVNGLDIITDSNIMSVSSNSNIVSVTGVDIANIGKSGATMNSEFISGIDSLSGLVINNSGITNVMSGVLATNNKNAVNMSATSTINKVGVTLVNTYAGAEANATNTAKSNIIFKSKEHNSESLNLNAKLKQTNDVGLESGNVTGFTINSAKLTSTVSGNLEIDVAGINNVKNTVNIISDSSSSSSAILSNLSVGLLVAVANVTLNSTVDSNANMNIAGTFNTNETIIKSNTERYSAVNLTSKSGGLVNVNSVSATNSIRGNSNITLDGFKSNDTSSINKLTVVNKSTNTNDTISTDSSGGFVSVSNISVDTVLDTNSTLNVKNSDIKSSKKINISLENDNIIKDSASLTNGGFVAVANNDTLHNYYSSAVMNIINSNIYSEEDVNLTTNSILRSASDDYIIYTANGGGFVASTLMTLKNILNQTSQIDIDNSTIKAKNDIIITAKTTTKFKQKIKTSAGGFVAIAKNWNTLDVTNNNKINVKSGSKILSANRTSINLDSNNDLSVYSEAQSSHFGFKDPQAESYLYLRVNNELNNKGSIEAGKLIDIDFMGNSYNNLYQYAYAEANAAIPTTTEDGILSKSITNILNVESGADITSGNDVIINFSTGFGISSSTIAYKCICYALFGIPITKSGSKSNYSYTHTAKLNLDGDIVAGRGNNKYMKINRDGTIDASTSGFYEDEYTLLNGQTLSPDDMKQNAIDSLTIDLNEVNGSITEVSSTIESVGDMITTIEAEKNVNQEILNMLNQKLSEGYQFITEEDLEIIINANIKEDIVLKNGEINTNKISEDLYNDILTKYDALCSEIAQRNNEKYEADSSATNFEEVPTIQEYLNNNYSSTMTDGQINYFVTSYNDEKNAFSTTEKGDFQVYGDKYILSKTSSNGDVINPVEDYENTIKSLDERLLVLNNLNKGYEKDLENLQIKQSTIKQAIEDARNTDYRDQDSTYAIIFNPLIMSSSALIKVSGITNSNITGQGNFKVTESGLRIDNYSNRSLYFDDIRFEKGSLNGLYIAGYSNSAFLDKPQAINNVNALNYIINGVGFENVPTNGVHYVGSNGNEIAEKGIVINNYYDTSNPLAPSTKQSDIIFMGDVKSNKDLFIWNESGDIIFLASDVLAENKKIYATQGNISILQFDNNIAFELSENSEVFAGNSFEIYSTKTDGDVCINNGIIKAGYGDRNITITDDMLNNLVEDPTTGEINMIDLGGSGASPYLNGSNNIKALYVNGKIILFDMKKSDENTGSIDINGKTSGSGQFIYTNGYSNIKIDNQTSKELVVNNLYNNKITGTISNSINGTLQGQTRANTEILSKGKITINKDVQSGLNTTSTNDGSILTISSLNGINAVENSKISSIGNTTIKNDVAGNLDIQGIMESNGDLIISNKSSANNTYLRIVNNILNKNGNLEITNNNGDMLLLGRSIKNISDNLDNKYNLTITNNSTNDFVLNGELYNQNGNMLVSSGGNFRAKSTITNDGGYMSLTSTAGSMTLDGAVSNNGGYMSLTSIAGSMTLDGAVLNDGGDMTMSSGGDFRTKSTITNVSGNMSILSKGGFAQEGDITNNNGDMIISAEGENGTVIGAIISNKNGNINITNKKGTLDILSTGAVLLNKDIGLTSGSNLESKDLNIIQNGEGLFSIYGDVYNEKGDMTLTANNENSGLFVGITLNNAGNDIDKIATVINKEGILTITNNGSQGIKVAGDVSSEKGGIISNTNSKVEVVRQVITADNVRKGQINFGGNSIIINEGDDGIVIDGDINNVGGQLEIINEKGSLTIGKLITETGVIEGNITNDYTIDESSTADDKDVSIKISNTGEGGINILGNITNKNEGDIVINNTNGGLIETSKDSTIYNNKGSISIVNDDKGGMTLAGDIEAHQDGIISIINNGSGNNGLKITNESYILSNNGDILIKNTTNGGINIAGDIATTKGKIDIINDNEKSALVLTKDSEIVNTNNVTYIKNIGNKGMSIGAKIQNKNEKIIIENNAGGLLFDRTARVENINAEIKITNKNSGDMKIFGNIFDKNKDINITNSDSNIIIGEIDSNNDNYVKTENANITIKQTNGSILNGVVDAINGHYNYDLGNPDSAYKTLLACGGNLVLDVVDGDIGASSLPEHKSSVDKASRNNTDSINVNISGYIIATAKNSNKTDSRLINLRAKQSDMKVKKIESDGGVILTACDWKQADERPTPDNEEYYKGYSILNVADDGQTPVIARDISLIASDNIGTENKQFIYNQTVTSGAIPTVNIEAENLINFKIISPEDVTVYVGKLVTKRGNLEFIFDVDAVISEISAGGNLHILQKAKNLTIGSIGADKSSAGGSQDILYPHDGIDYQSPAGSPLQISIEVLDAINGGDSANSTLKINSAYVRGANNGAGEFDTDGNRVPDVKFMADNIFVSAKNSPNASILGNKTQKGAQGLNACGKGNKLAIEVKGVSKEFVENNVENANRTNYNIQKSVKDIPKNFVNPNDSITDYDYKANNVIISVNNKDTVNRGVIFTNLYADKAFIDTKDEQLSVKDAYITDYAEFRNGNGHNSYKYTTVVDNGKKKHLVPKSTWQLYTEKTGSFGFDMDHTIVLKTMAPVVHFEQHKLVNTYNSEKSMFNLTYKENKIQQKNKDNGFLFGKKHQIVSKDTSLIFDTTNDKNLKSNTIIYNLSTKGALIKNDNNLKRGKITTLCIEFDDVKVELKAKVKDLHADKADVQFLNMPKDVANKLLYRYMQQAHNSKRNNLGSL